MPGLVETLHGAFAELRIELTVDGTRPLVDGMRRGELDRVFCLHPVLDEGFRCLVACVLPMVWAGALRVIEPERRCSVSELAERPVISFPRYSPPFR